MLDDDGAIRFRERRATPRGDYDGTVDALVDLVAAAEAAIGQTATVGIGMPGAISPATGLVKNANSTWLIGRTLDRDLEARLGRPVRLANDANCFALSEASDGAAAGAPVVFGVIVGTGCGGGVVVARPGPHRAQRHRRRVGPQSPAVARAATNCPGPSATAASAAASRRICRARAWRATTPRARGVDPSEIKGATVVARAAAGDRHAVAALDRYAHRLARGLATVINTLDPDVIVLGGGVSNVAMLVRRRAALARTSSSSPITSRRGSCRRCMGTPVASAARRGCGHAAITIDRITAISADYAIRRWPTGARNRRLKRIRASSRVQRARGAARASLGR